MKHNVISDVTDLEVIEQLWYKMYYINRIIEIIIDSYCSKDNDVSKPDCETCCFQNYCENVQLIKKALEME